MLFVLSLSSIDPITQVVQSVSVVVSLGLAYFSVRRKFNIVGLILLVVSGYINVSFLIHTLYST